MSENVDLPPTIKSNNPFRNSILQTSTTSSDSLSTIPNAIMATTPPVSKTPTIVEVEEDVGRKSGSDVSEKCLMRDAEPVNAATVVNTNGVPPPAYPQPVIKKTRTNDQIFITIEGGSSASLQRSDSSPAHRFSVECCEQSTMWPARRILQKARLRNKRIRTTVKVVLSIVIIVGAVAIGLGIRKAVADSRKPKN